MTTDDRLTILADYVINLLTIKQCAEKYGRGDDQVRRMLHRYGVVRAPMGPVPVKERPELVRDRFNRPVHISEALAKVVEKVEGLSGANQDS